MIDDETRKYLDAVMDAILIRVDARFDAMQLKMDARFDAQQARFNDGVERLLERVNRLESKDE